MEYETYQDAKEELMHEAFKNYKGFTHAEPSKRQINVRLTERGIMRLDELAKYLQVPRNLVVEWLVTLYHEKLVKLEGGDNHEEKGS